MYPPVDIPSCKIMLMDDHVLMSSGMAELLKRMLPGCEVLFFDKVEKAKNALKTNDYLFLLSDLLMPGQNVREFIHFCRKEYPSLVLIIVSSVIDVNVIREYLAVGVDGYLSKSTNEYELRQALELTYKGRKYISSDLSGKLAASVFSIDNTTLTKKELEVLRLVAAGHNVRKIAEQLFVSPVTVMTHRRSILVKLGLHSAAELVKYAFENNLT